jgi:UPF0755 protein
MKKHARKGIPAGCLIFLLLIALALAALALAVIALPGKAQADFGRPDPNLGLANRIIDSARLLLAKSDLLEPVDPQGTEQPFTINVGESANSVFLRLEQEGLIRSATAFRVYMIYTGMDVSIQAGNYQLSPAWNSLQIAHKLQDATPTQVSFVILPGLRSQEIAAILATSGLDITQNQFMQAVDNPPSDWLPADLATMDSLEGYLFPGSYTFQRSATLREVIQTFLGQFESNVSDDMRSAYEKNGLTLQQAVTLASIVQREGVVEDEHPLIASVFYNRLAVGMPLAADPTVQYALGYNSQQSTWWTNPLTQADLEVNSPYNTYINTGLPPGPISNPGVSALQSVAYPAQTHYYYFRAKCDGSGLHSFAETYAEHVQNACP